MFWKFQLPLAAPFEIISLKVEPFHPILEKFEGVDAEKDDE